MDKLDEVDTIAAEVGAVNVIDNHHGKLTGYNTDTVGFSAALDNILTQQKAPNNTRKALILGTGGVANAIAFVLKHRLIEFSFVSRTNKDCLLYEQLTDDIISSHSLIINCTPLGMYPDTESLPMIPYNVIGPSHILFDTIYNPQQTLFLKEADRRGAKTFNGRYMLEQQAYAAWEIWKHHVG